MTAHIAVLHRWAAPYALYERYADHRAEHVTYITTEVGARGVPDGAAAVELVEATDDPGQAEAALTALETRFGPAGAVVGLKEDDLLTAATLRARRGLPGPRPHELIVFRDKLAMVRAAAAAGAEVPRTAPADSAAAIRRFGDRHGWPVVLKPRSASSSTGVRILGRGEADDEDLCERIGRYGDHLVQELVSGTLVHVDGVYTEGGLPVWRAARYLGSPLSFRDGGWVGSVDVDGAEMLAAVGEHTAAVMTGLAGELPTVFHLEAFVSSGAEPRCTFLEVGARAGGAEIPLLWREVHGHDLMHTAFRLSRGDRSAVEELPPPPVPAEIGGLLLLAAPAERPCEITRSPSALGREWAPLELYGQDVPAVGDVLSHADSYYEHVGGRFRFRGASTAAVEAAIREVAGSVTVTGRPPATASGRAVQV